MKREYRTVIELAAVGVVLLVACLVSVSYQAHASAGVPPYANPDEHVGDTLRILSNYVILPVFLVGLADSSVAHAAGLGLSMVMQWFFVYYIKYLTGALRPDGVHLGSFPSGHTATAACECYYMLLIILIYRPTPLLVSIPAMLALLSYPWYVATSRIVNNRHFAADVVASHVIGGTVAGGVLFLVRRASEERS